MQSCVNENEMTYAGAVNPKCIRPNEGSMVHEPLNWTTRWVHAPPLL